MNRCATRIVTEQDRSDIGKIDIAGCGYFQPVDIGACSADLNGAEIADIDTAGIGLRFDNRCLRLDCVTRRPDAAPPAQNGLAGDDVRAGVAAKFSDGVVSDERDNAGGGAQVRRRQRGAAGGGDRDVCPGQPPDPSPDPP